MEVQTSNGANTAYLSVQQTTSQKQAQQSQQTQTAETQQNTPDSMALNPAAQPADQVKLSSSVTVKNLDTVKAIEQMHTRMNQLVKGTRETNEALNKAAEQVNFMQGNLTSIIKNFPPFPIDSKERQELLMSYTSIRQEMMKMTIPQPPPPMYEQVKHEWDKTVGQNGQMLSSAVPALETTSSDTQVNEAAAQLENASAGLANLSSSVTKALIGG
ncbi:hypothetical protein [Trichlorobacter lovleyi]|uniref:hypothetical protein n=1 Tax=Trichlorobacter lovleyi TaxID=313985 RepID=UPI0024809031|nr:hypothetical protein [Trichlorobacter lovleyi]